MSKVQAVKRVVDLELRPVLQKMNSWQQQCSSQATEYAICAAAKGFDVQEKECDKQFQAYMACIRAARK